MNYYLIEVKNIHIDFCRLNIIQAPIDSDAGPKRSVVRLRKERWSPMGHKSWLTMAYH